MMMDTSSRWGACQGFTRDFLDALGPNCGCQLESPNSRLLVVLVSLVLNQVLAYTAFLVFLSFFLLFLKSLSIQECKYTTQS
jgi:hypothetical protein